MNAHGATRPADRRCRPDRRVKPISSWSAIRLMGRRRAFRRVSDGCDQTVDCPMPSVIVLVLWVTLCSALDALFTLLYIANGGGEANPLMALALSYGNVTFVSFKMAVTCLGVGLLSLLHHMPLAYTLLKALTLMYLGIMAIHTLLLFF